jgi:hypothetical protein
MYAGKKSGSPPLHHLEEFVMYLVFTFAHSLQVMTWALYASPSMHHPVHPSRLLESKLMSLSTVHECYW